MNPALAAVAGVEDPVLGIDKSGAIGCQRLANVTVDHISMRGMDAGQKLSLVIDRSIGGMV